jgi:hypothetical protein
MVPPAGLFRGFWNSQAVFQHLLNGAAGRFAEDTIGGGHIVSVQQVFGNRGLAQQFRVGALTQRFGTDLFTRCVQ